MADFDPNKNDVDKVLAHLEQSDDDERERVLLAESEGKDRKAIRDWSPSDDSDESAADGEQSTEKSETESDEDEIHDFPQTEENAVHLLAAAASLGLHKDVVTTKNGRLQAPESVVRAADITPEKD